MADPGFPRRGRQPKRGECQHINLPKFPENCMKIKKSGPRRGGEGTCPKFVYVDPPLIKSALIQIHRQKKKKQENINQNLDFVVSAVIPGCFVVYFFLNFAFAF